jgi:histidinol phosphatase-like enzyme
MGEPIYLRQNIGSKKFGSYRKPGPGMINYLLWHFSATAGETWFIGDRSEDEGAARAANVPFLHRDVWLSSGTAFPEGIIV